jgi:hypothetical protein
MTATSARNAPSIRRQMTRREATVSARSLSEGPCGLDDDDASMTSLVAVRPAVAGVMRSRFGEHGDVEPRREAAELDLARRAADLSGDSLRSAATRAPA